MSLLGIFKGKGKVCTVLANTTYYTKYITLQYINTNVYIMPFFDITAAIQVTLYPF